LECGTTRSTVWADTLALADTPAMPTAASIAAIRRRRLKEIWNTDFSLDRLRVMDGT